ncbi:MAG TPA: CDP-alcohol phosphatidyltransferase family protein [Actinomycetota bacterium]|nr:CDP-alcohol phosphatidyltransferase family protein [Actinomycetota bacterium]
MSSAPLPLSSSTPIDGGHKIPEGYRYLNISTLWIPYYRLVIQLFYRLHIRHEVATALSIFCGLAAAWVIAGLPASGAFPTAAVLVHLKDVFDATDGSVARMTGTGHRFGRFLDTVGDGVAFTAWIGACAWLMAETGTSVWAAAGWAVAGWLCLFLQCSYFNFHHLHYVRIAGAASTSRLDEREVPVEQGDRATRAMASVYQAWFGWQDRLIARFDRAQRRSLGLPEQAEDPRCNGWYGARPFLVANSALCFGTHVFVLVVLLVARRPEWFLPSVTIGMTFYWALIVVARRLVFRRSARLTVASG